MFEKVFGMKVLELFAGISTGVLALTQLGYSLDRVVSYEIDEAPKKVAKENFPFIEHHSDVRDCNGNDFKDFDLLLGGSSCQDLSSCNRVQSGLTGDKSSIFWEYVRIWEQMGKPQFLFENVGGMKKSDKDIISAVFECEPIHINSKDFSPALRNRYYWTNIKVDVNSFSLQTENSQNLQDILTHGYTDRKKARALLASDSRPLSSPVKMMHRYQGKGFTTIIFLSKKHYIDCLEHYNKHFKGCSAVEVDAKIAIGLNVDVYTGVRYLNQVELERCMCVPNGYTSVLSRNKASHALGNGWTNSVIKQLLKNVERNKND
jgi:DNA (cytosine-5)-methyltransferase 3A